MRLSIGNYIDGLKRVILSIQPQRSGNASDPPAPPAAAPYIPPAPVPMAQHHEQPPPSVQNPAPMQDSAPTTFNFKKSPPKSITIINS